MGGGGLVDLNAPPGITGRGPDWRFLAVAGVDDPEAPGAFGGRLAGGWVGGGVDRTECAFPESIELLPFTLPILFNEPLLG